MVKNLLSKCRGQVVSTIDELRTITTHDNNLERQYKEGKLSILQLITGCVLYTCSCVRECPAKLSSGEGSWRDQGIDQTFTSLSVYFPPSSLTPPPPLSLSLFL